MGWCIVQHNYCLFGNSFAEAIKQFYEFLLTIALLLHFVNKVAFSGVKSSYVYPLAFTGQKPYCLAFLLPGVRQTGSQAKATFIIVKNIYPIRCLKLFKLVELLPGVIKTILIALLL